jgi:hypothetical protein
MTNEWQFDYFYRFLLQKIVLPVQPSGLFASNFQNKGLQVSQILPVTLSLHVHRVPGATFAQPPCAKNVPGTPLGSQLHSSHNG